MAHLRRRTKAREVPPAVHQVRNHLVVEEARGLRVGRKQRRHVGDFGAVGPLVAVVAVEAAVEVGEQHPQDAVGLVHEAHAARQVAHHHGVGDLVRVGDDGEVRWCDASAVHMLLQQPHERLPLRLLEAADAMLPTKRTAQAGKIDGGRRDLWTHARRERGEVFAQEQRLRSALKGGCGLGDKEARHCRREDQHVQDQHLEVEPKGYEDPRACRVLGGHGHQLLLWHPRPVPVVGWPVHPEAARREPDRPLPTPSRDVRDATGGARRALRRRLHFSLQDLSRTCRQTRPSAALCALAEGAGPQRGRQRGKS
mmetsp:Transcript_5993/g.13949  ORF Transcript_5993/g.13949 Transcript_5993/m.13949 type:complete len:311 (+) Transcript_5993:426-1358(+)